MRTIQSLVLITFCLGGLMVAACSPKQTEVSPAEVARQAEAYLRAQSDAGYFSGAVLITREGTELYRGAFGLADASTRTPNAPATRFRIASITKTFTAAVVLKLVEQGRLKLEDTLGAHLAPCPEAWRSITVRQLLTHTSGIFNYSDLPEFTAIHHLPYTQEQIIGTFRERAPEFPPGQQYRYSNSNYLLLAQVVDKVTGRAFEDVLRAEVLEPLGLNDTGVDRPLPGDPALAKGYRPDGMERVEAPPLEMGWVRGAGAMYSTVADLEKWTRALAEERVFPPATLRKMWQADKGAYGYGWQVLDLWPPKFGRPLVFHAGGLNGFASDLLHYPRERITIVILANLETSPMAGIARDLSAIVFGADYTLPVVRQAVTVAPVILDRYVGNYQLAPQVTINVRREDSRLVVQATGQPEDIAVPESETRFFSRRSDAQITFVPDTTGRITHLVLHQGGRDLTAPRQQ